MITPRADLRWHFDTFGNSVAEASFSEPSDLLAIQSDLLIRRYPLNTSLFSLDHGKTPYPFIYSEDDYVDLAPLVALQDPNELPVLEDWLDSAFQERPAEAFAFLRELGNAIHSSFEYFQRDELGTQSTAATIANGHGTCRDFAFLFMEAARSFGFAARFVTGYLHDPLGGRGAVVGGGATHAWADVFIPGDGWVEFDPTNRIVGGAPLIRVAVTRTPAQASPITGTFVGTGVVFLGMDVTVAVTEVPPLDAMEEPTLRDC